MSVPPKNKCCVSGCKTRYYPRCERKFFSVPVPNHSKRFVDELELKLIEKRRNLWMRAINNPDVNTNVKAGPYVCSDHFVSGKPASLYHEDSVDWVPSLKLPPVISEDPSTVIGEHCPSQSKQLVVVDSSEKNSQLQITDGVTNILGHFCAVPDEKDLSTQRPESREDPSYCVLSGHTAETAADSTLTPLDDPLGHHPESQSPPDEKIQPWKEDLESSGQLQLVKGPSANFRLDLFFGKDDQNVVRQPDGETATESNGVDHKIEEHTKDPLSIADEDLPHFCAVADEANLRTQRLNFREDNSYNVRPVKFAEAMGTGTPSPLEDPLEQRPVDLDAVVKMEVLEEESDSSWQLGLAKGTSLNFRVDLFFGGDDQKIAYYTGFKGLEKLWLVFRFVEDRLDANGCRPDESTLPLFEQFCLALMYLQHGFHPRDLAYRFHMEREDVATFIERWISILHQVLVPAHVIWPRRTQCSETERNRCIAIVETIRVPEGAWPQQDSAAQFLATATPSGSFLFVSKCFTGSPRPEVVWTTSGIFDHLEPGDLVLTESGRSLYVVRPRKQSFRVESAPPKPTSDGKSNQLEFQRLGSHEAEGILRTVTVNPFESLWRRFAVIRQGFEALSFASPPSLDQVVNVCCALHNASPNDATSVSS